MGTSLPPRPPLIIFNSSQVIHLAVALRGLDFLPSLYGRVLVPEPNWMTRPGGCKPLRVSA